MIGEGECYNFHVGRLEPTVSINVAAWEVVLYLGFLGVWSLREGGFCVSGPLQREGG